MESPAIRQRLTLSDQLSVLSAASNLRDLLKFRDDDVATSTPSRSRPAVTLAAVLQAEKESRGRTLLDVIRDDEESRSGGSSSSSRWRDLTDRVRIRPAATWTAGSASVPPEPPAETARPEPGGVRVSLMTLMEMREREEEEGDAAAAVMAMAEAADGAAALEEDDVTGGRQVCCVCMVRKKGAAFIPCGHTFCRVCSRELFVGRGNCPLCNASIIEVLDIF